MSVIYTANQLYMNKQNMVTWFLGLFFMGLKDEYYFLSDNKVCWNKHV